VKVELRPYQRTSVTRALAATGNPIECAPTGSGKTVCQAFVCKEGWERKERTAILTPRIEIFDQTHSALMDMCGYENVGTLRSGHNWDSYKPIHVVSWPTLVSRMSKSDLWLPDVDRILCDEAHLSVSPKALEILEHYHGKGIPIIGYTATPARKTGKGLGVIYDAINEVATVRQLQKEGYLCEVEYWGGKLADLTDVKIIRGDYETGALSKSSRVIVGDVVDNWMRLAKDRHTIVFAVDIAHAEALTDRFLELGVSAGCIHSRLTPEKRDDVMRRFRATTIQVLVNVTILSYGVDVPSISCIVCARETKSIVLWKQMLGRGMRPHGAKDFCMVVDHTRNTRDLGMAEDDCSWSLESGVDAVKNKTQEEKEARQENNYTCGECNYIFSGTRECPRCGWEKPFAKVDVAIIDAELVRIGKYQAKPLGDGWPTHEMLWRMLKAEELRRGYKVGWAYHKFREKAGVPPDRKWEHLAFVPAVPRVLNWIQSRNIAYAKRARAKV